MKTKSLMTSQALYIKQEMLMKTKINGITQIISASDDDVKEYLLKRGISAFMRAAGAMQSKVELSEFDDLPTFSVVSNERRNAYWSNREPQMHYYVLWIKCDEPMCNNCTDLLELAVQPKRLVIQFKVLAHNNDEKCVFCDGMCDDRLHF